MCQFILLFIQMYLNILLINYIATAVILVLVSAASIIYKTENVGVYPMYVFMFAYSSRRVTQICLKRFMP